MALDYKQKIRYYQEALRTYQSVPYGPFICNVLYISLDKDFPDIKYGNHAVTSEIICEYFPEFYMLFKIDTAPFSLSWPTDDHGNSRREWALNEAIKICKKEINKQDIKNIPDK